MFLPRVLWQYHVFKFLCPADLLRCARVCHVWREIIAHDKTTWKRFEWPNGPASLYHCYLDLRRPRSFYDLTLIMQFLFPFLTKLKVELSYQLMSFWIEKGWFIQISAHYPRSIWGTTFYAEKKGIRTRHTIFEDELIEAMNWCLFKAQRATTIEDAREIFRPCKFLF